MGDRPGSVDGAQGLDLFRMARRTIRGWVWSAKVAGDGVQRQPHTTLAEEKLILYLEYHPLVRTYQRGDLHADFAAAHRISAPLGTPYGIAYTWGGQPHTYLPDVVGRFMDGGLLIAEAGVAAEKDHGVAVAKANAARMWAACNGGAYWLATERHLTSQCYYNWLFLHANRLPFRLFVDIAPAVLARWRDGEPLSVRQLLAQLGGRWSPQEVEAAAWKVAAEAAARGHLVADLGTSLTLDTPLAVLAEDAPALLPPALPDHLEPETTPVAAAPAAVLAECATPLMPRGDVFDPSVLSSAALRQAFYAKRAAVQAVGAGESLRAAARQHGLSASWLGRLVARVGRYGERALVSHRVYHRTRALAPACQTLIAALYRSPMRPSIAAITEHPELRQLAEDQAAASGAPVSLPTYRQVYHYIQSIKHTDEAVTARAALRHAPPSARSTTSFIRSISGPAMICQVDEHSMDLWVVLSGGAPHLRKIHCAALICVKTNAILSVVLSLDVLSEEDYMLLIKRALEPKDELVALAGCKHAWACTAKPAVIFSDRGAIFTSQRATEVLVDRLQIVEQQAPPYCPTAKGTVEALFKWVVERFSGRLPGTTKRSPAARGRYDAAREAERAGITLDVLEGLFIQAIVDDWMQAWDTLRRQQRSVLWDEAVRVHGVPRWLGTRDELVLLLMRRQNRRNPPTGRYAIHPGKGISFLGRWYVAPRLLDRLRGKEIDIYYTKWDLSTIHLFLDGSYVGPAICADLAGRRLSIWEAEAERQAARAPRAMAQAEAQQNRTAIQARARRGKAAHRATTEELRREREAAFAKKRLEAQPEEVQRILAAIAESTRQREAPPGVEAPALVPPPVPDAQPPAFRAPIVRRRFPDEP
jgi:hypothetical protein